MAMKREKKEEVLGKLKDALSNSETVAFVNFKGLGVAETTDMRGQLSEQGVGYTVAKKTLIKSALDDAKVDGDRILVSGTLFNLINTSFSPL